MAQGAVALLQYLLEVQHPLRRLDAGVQFLGVERLGQEIVGTGIHAFQQVVVGVAAGQQDNVDVVGQGGRTDMPAQLHAVHLGHDPVADDQSDGT